MVFYHRVDAYNIMLQKREGFFCLPVSWMPTRCSDFLSHTHTSFNRRSSLRVAEYFIYACAICISEITCNGARKCRRPLKLSEMKSDVFADLILRSSHRNLFGDLYLPTVAVDLFIVRYFIHISLVSDEFYLWRYSLKRRQCSVRVKEWNCLQSVGRDFCGKASKKTD